MRKISLNLLLFIFAIITGLRAYNPNDSDEENAKNKKKEIATVGDSITFGYCSRNRNASSYPAFLAAYSGSNVTNYGVM